MLSTSGLSITSRKRRAWADIASTYLRCPSAKMVSKASEDFPEPDGPVMTTNRFLGMSRSRPRRLCWRAPRIRMASFAGGIRDRRGETPIGRPGLSSPLKKPIRATAGPCSRNTALRSLAESLDSTRLRALSSAAMTRSRLQSDFNQRTVRMVRQRGLEPPTVRYLGRLLSYCREGVGQIYLPPVPLQAQKSPLDNGGRNGKIKDLPQLW